MNCTFLISHFGNIVHLTFMPIKHIELNNVIKCAKDTVAVLQANLSWHGQCISDIRGLHIACSAKTSIRY